MCRILSIQIAALMIVAWLQRDPIEMEFGNKFSRDIFLKCRAADSGVWSNEVHIKQGKIGVLLVDSYESYELMWRDSEGREHPMGSFPLKRMYETADPKLFYLSSIHKEVERTYTVRVPVTQTRTETYLVQVPYQEQVAQRVLVNGRWETRLVTITRQRQEQRTREVPFTSYQFETRSQLVTWEGTGLVYNDGSETKTVSGEFSGRRLGINAHKCPIGIHVDSVKSGAAVTECWDNEGKVWAVESGDHILTVNQHPPADISDLTKALDHSTGPVLLEVLDKDGRTRRSLWCVPR